MRDCYFLCCFPIRIIEIRVFHSVYLRLFILFSAFKAYWEVIKYSKIEQNFRLQREFKYRRGFFFFFFLFFCFFPPAPVWNVLFQEDNNF